MSRVPIVVVFGATGTGKSKLAIQIAKKFNGEIISADSMQVYKELNIASNKVTEAERIEVPHYMLDICKPVDRFSVLDYRNQTLPIIQDILRRQKLPILVGGTCYYIESVLWSILSEAPKEESQLIFNRYRVIKNPNEINKWKTYEASVATRFEDSLWLKETQPQETQNQTTIDKVEIDGLVKEIERIVRHFHNVLLDVENSLSVSFSLYERTFYRMPSDNFDEFGDTRKLADYAKDESGFSNFVDLEIALVTNYINVCLDTFTQFFFDADDEQAADSLNFSGLWNHSIRGCLLKRVIPEKKNLDTTLRQFSDWFTLQDRSLPKRILRKLLDSIEEVVRIRIKRLRMLRIIDDECMLDFTNEQLFEELTLLDEDAVRFLHPNNRRKIIRAIQIYLTSGKPFTDLLEESNDSGTGPPLRFPNACLLLLSCNQTVLDLRLDKRVDQMVENGLVKELENFHKRYNLERLKYNMTADYTKGIFQSIGLKELHPYLMLDEETKRSRLGQKTLREGIRSLKIVTRRYSRLQYRAIMNRFIRITDKKKAPPLFELDCTDLENWKENVESKALTIVEGYVNGNSLFELPYSPVDLEEPHPDRYQNGRFFCDICQRLFIGRYQWQMHYTSKGHRKQLYQLKVKALQQKLVNLRESADDHIHSDDVEDNLIWELFSSSNEKI